MTRKEIEKRKKELQAKILEVKTQEELAEIRKQVEEISKEVPEDESTEEKNDGTISHEEERSLINDTQNLEKRSVNPTNLQRIGGNKEMDKEERKFTIADKEYRTAWAKKIMGYSDEKFTEDEKRALGDAITTTSTEFVAATDGVNGINNGGLFIPTSVREELMELISKESPIFRDIRKLQVNGNIDLPYLFASDDSKWYAETTDTENAGEEFRNLQLTGWELARDIVITWKLEEMAVESFISFLLDELKEKMGKALINAVIYGTGSSQPKGITAGLTAIKTGNNQIENILNVFEALSDDAAIGAKVYISRKASLNIMKYKDNNGNYPFLAGVPAFMAFKAEVDPYLKDFDVIAGNARYYILNENTPVRVDKEKTLKGRKVTYGAYGIYDGKAKPNSFTYGQYNPTNEGV